MKHRANISTGILPAKLWRDLAEYAGTHASNEDFAIAGNLVMIAALDPADEGQRRTAIMCAASICQHLAKLAKCEREGLSDECSKTSAPPSVEWMRGRARMHATEVCLQARLARAILRVVEADGGGTA